jgi:hypothetical protein
MKKLIVPVLAGFSAMTLLSGCLFLDIGGGMLSEAVHPSVGQGLIDLQKAKDAGAITDAEYQAQKDKLLGKNLTVEGGKSAKPVYPTVGQQLIDLQKAKDTGAITDAEYEAQKAKLLGKK